MYYNFEIYLIILIIEIPIFIASMRRSSFLPFPHGIMLYIIGAQTVCLFASLSWINSRFLMSYSSYYFVDHYFSVCAIPMIVFMAAALFSPHIKIKASLLPKLIKIPSSLPKWVTIMIYLHIFAFLISANLGLVWENHKYLLMTGPGILKINGRESAFLVALLKPIGLISWVLLAYMIISNKRRAVIALAPTSAFYYIYMLGAHSRTSAAFLVVFTVVVILGRKGKAVGVASALASVLTLMACLAGRSTGNHGISSVQNTFSLIASVKAQDLGEFLINVFEGIFVTGETFDISHVYPISYKFLSLSPTLSFIDNFSAIRAANTVMITPYAPASALTEIFLFGPIWWVAYAGVMGFSAYLSNKIMKRRRDAISFAVNSCIFLSWFLQFTYPSRLTTRFAYLGLSISVALMIHGRIASKRKNRRRPRLRVEAARNAVANSPVVSRVSR